MAGAICRLLGVISTKTFVIHEYKRAPWTPPPRISWPKEPPHLLVLAAALLTNRKDRGQRNMQANAHYTLAYLT